MNPIDIECPFCGADVGAHCNWGTWTNPSLGFHISRLAKAGQGMFAHEAELYQ